MSRTDHGHRSRHVIRREGPATDWLDGLPIGNGQQGVMVQAGADRDVLSMNDARAWSGSALSALRGPLLSAQEAAAAISEARSRIKEGRSSEATAPLQRLQHRHSQTFLPIGEISIRYRTDEACFPDADVERSLDLGTATHTARSIVGEDAITRRAWASREDCVVVFEVESSTPITLDISASSPLRVLSLDLLGEKAPVVLPLLLPSDVPPSHDTGPEGIEYDESDGASLRAAIVADWVHDGTTVASGGDHGVASGVRHCVIVISTAVSNTGAPTVGAREALRAARESIDAAWGLGVADLRRRHVEVHSELYDRVELDLVGGDDILVDTAARIASVAAHGLRADPDLAALLFHYGRYLLIASTRVGSPPPNLQGIWNGQLQPPWSSNYTMNINLEMNFWLVEVAQLPELAVPLFDFIDLLVLRGAEPARRLHGARGWVAHHNSDRWGYPLPVGNGTHDPMWAFWPFAGVWLARHLRDHLEFGALSVASPEEFAKSRMWSVTSGAAEFVLSWLQEDDRGFSSSPSTSPENQFLDEAGSVSSAGRSSTVDISLSRDLLQTLDELAAMIGVEGDPIVERARQIWPRLPFPTIGRGEMIAEWEGDPAPVDPEHRHQSHLWFLYPGSRSYPPSLTDAARRSLDARGDESTGWSLVWRMALRARLRDPEGISRLLTTLFKPAELSVGMFDGGLYRNLLAAHPPFQIDANFGYVAALAEALVQSHRGEIELLPALPPEFPDGEVRGLLARPGVVVDVAWREGRPERIRIRSCRGHREIAVRYRGRTTSVTVDDEPIDLDLIGLGLVDGQSTGGD